MMKNFKNKIRNTKLKWEQKRGKIIALTDELRGAVRSVSATLSPACQHRLSTGLSLSAVNTVCQRALSPRSVTMIRQPLSIAIFFKLIYYVDKQVNFQLKI